MSYSETITRADLTNILNEVLPNTSVDYIVEQGTSGNWHYRKWNSGRAELWGKFTQTVTSYTANAFIIGSSSVTPYPFAVTNPIVQATGIKMGTGSCHVSCDYERTDYWSGVANPINATVAKGQSREITWSLYVNARWK